MNDPRTRKTNHIDEGSAKDRISVVVRWHRDEVCGASGNGVQFSLFPGVAGYRFGEICVECEEKK